MKNGYVMDKTSNDIIHERMQQDEKWGVQDHDPLTWLAILGEEVGEANQAALDNYNYREKQFQGDLSHLREELIQVAAVAKAFVECLDRGVWRDKKPDLYQRMLQDRVNYTEKENLKLLKKLEKYEKTFKKSKAKKIQQKEA